MLLSQKHLHQHHQCLRMHCQVLSFHQPLVLSTQKHPPPQQQCSRIGLRFLLLFPPLLEWLFLGQSRCPLFYCLLFLQSRSSIFFISMTCKGIKRGATVELTSSPYKQQLLEQQKVNTGTVNKAKYSSKRGKASKTFTIVTEEPDGNSTDYEEAQCLYCNDYILIRLKVKFGFSTTCKGWSHQECATCKGWVQCTTCKGWSHQECATCKGWVQCTTCKGWSHQECAGVEGGDFICEICSD